MPDIYLRSVPSDANSADVRLYDPTLFPGVISGPLAWTSQNDTWAVASTITATGTIAIQSGNDAWAISGTATVTGTVNVQSGNDTWSLTGAAAVSGAVSFISQNDTWALASTVGAGGVSGELAWTSQNDGWSMAGNVASVEQRLGGVWNAPWAQSKKRIGEDELAEILGIRAKASEQVQALIREQAEKVRKTQEAQTADLEAAFAAMQLEYSDMYARVLALEIQLAQERMQEEEAFVALVMAALI